MRKQEGEKSFGRLKKNAIENAKPQQHAAVHIKLFTRVQALWSKRMQAAYTIRQGEVSTPSLIASCLSHAINQLKLSSMMFLYPNI